MIDRLLDDNEVLKLKDVVREYRHLSLHGNNFLALYGGTRKEFLAANNTIANKVAKTKGPVKQDSVQSAGRYV